jgi:hypothetical protein
MADITLADVKARMKEFKETCPDSDVAFYGWLGYDDVEFLVASLDKAIAALKEIHSEVADNEANSIATEALRELGEIE